MKTIHPLLFRPLILTITYFDSLTHFTSFVPWVLNSSVTNHIAGNNYFSSSMSTMSYLPLIAMANGSRKS